MEAIGSTKTDAAAQRKNAARRLTALSTKNKSNPFIDIVWPESLPENTLWMPHALMTVFGTQAAANLTPQELCR